MGWKKQIIINVLFFFGIYSCTEDAPKVIDFVTKQSNSQIDSMYQDFLNKYKEIAPDQIFYVDSLYDKIQTVQEIPPKYVRSFLPSVHKNYLSYSRYGFKTNLSSELFCLISLLQGDSLTYQMDIFNSKQENIGSLPVNKIYGINGTCYSYRTNVYLNDSILVLRRYCLQIVDDNYTKRRDVPLYNGRAINSEWHYQIKRNNLVLIKESSKDVKLSVDDEAPMGLKIIN